MWTWTWNECKNEQKQRQRHYHYHILAMKQLYFCVLKCIVRFFECKRNIRMHGAWQCCSCIQHDIQTQYAVCTPDVYKIREKTDSMMMKKNETTRNNTKMLNTYSVVVGFCVSCSVVCRMHVLFGRESRWFYKTNEMKQKSEKNVFNLI